MFFLGLRSRDPADEKLHQYAQLKALEGGFPAHERYDIEPRIHADPGSTSNHLCLVPRGRFTCKKRVEMALDFMDTYLTGEKTGQIVAFLTKIFVAYLDKL